ncbi:MAG: peptidylprolyl isomerase [Armatimonadetes bacterium]|nr:peptidylprolyl isomerase [Armatimonadota bacterium]MBX3109728.1 peptidylprolyl isomerase [Fimbriimonadaceae bacterium]
MTRGLVSAVCAMAVATAGTTSGPLVAANPTMTLKVAGKGDVVIELYQAEAPKTVAHIVQLAKSGFYDGQKFYAVLKEPRPFLVRFGDPNTKSKPMNDPSIGQGGSGARIEYEKSGKSHVKGAVGLATRADDPKAGDSQFYIMLDNKPFLDNSYTVFGQVTRGMEIVSSIEVGDQVTSVSISGD